MTPTYGEAWYQSKVDIYKQDSLEVKEIKREHKKRMDREEASKYYNKKLFSYWLSMLDDRIKLENKKKLLSALMFSHTDAFKQKIGVA